MNQLILTYKDSVFRIKEKAGVFRIGRHPENHLRLDQAFVSKFHGQIQGNGNGFFYRDMDSVNGTWFRGTRLGQDGGSAVMELTGKGVLNLGGPGHLGILFKTEQDPFVNALARGRSLVASGQAREAAAQFNAVIDQAPGLMDAYFYAGQAELEAKNFMDAIVRFEQYLTLRRNDTLAMTLLGNAYEKTGRLDKAGHWYQKAVKTGNNPKAKERIRVMAQYRPAPKAMTEDLLRSDMPNTARIDHFELSYNISLHSDAVKPVLKAFALAHRQMIAFFADCRTFSRKLESLGQVPVTLVNTDQADTGRTGPKGIWLRLNPGTLKGDRFLDMLIRHEYAHFILGTLTGFSAQVPWWFHEGFAQYMSQNFNPNRLMDNGRTNQSRLQIPLSAIEREPSNHDADRAVLKQAYFMSHAAMVLLVRQYGETGLRELIRYLAAEEEIRKAFQRADLNYYRFETALSNWLAGGMPQREINATQVIG